MKKEILKQFLNTIAGFLLLMHGFAIFEKDEAFDAFIFFGIAFSLFIIAGLIKWLHTKFRKAEALFFVLQAAALIYSGIIYYNEKNIAMQLVSFTLAIAFFVYGIVLFTKKKKRRRRSSRSSESAF